MVKTKKPIKNHNPNFKTMLKAMIIDDEPDSLRLLSLELEKYCPEVRVVATCADSESGLQTLLALKPDLLFLDIEMPRMNGFQLLEQAGGLSFGLIFTTAYDQYAVKAFKYSAVDYLMKPIESEELKAAVEKARGQQALNHQHLEVLQQQLSHSHATQPEKIALPNRHGYTFVDFKKILYCESDGNYTKVFLDTGEIFLVTKNLGEIEDLLSDLGFFRAHKQYLVQINRIKEFFKDEGTYLTMENNASIPVARNRVEDFKRYFMKF